MKLLGRDINARGLMERVEGQLRARGLLERGDGIRIDAAADPLSVEPLSYNLSALEKTADPLSPRGSHFGLAERLVRLAVRPLLEAALGTQREFNGHVRDSYAQLSAEVIRLRAEVAELKKNAGAPTAAERGNPRSPKAAATADETRRRRSPAQRTPKHR